MVNARSICWLFGLGSAGLWSVPAHALDPFTDGSAALVNGALSSGVSLGIADMNGDCLDDLVRLDGTDVLEIEYQQPDGSFELFHFGELPGNGSWSMSIGDIDGNGFNDIFTSGPYDGLKILLANEDGTDYTMSTLTGPDVFTQCSNFADIDNDGALDLFVCHDDGLSSPYSGDGTGALTYTPGLIVAASTNPSDNSGNYGSVWTDYDSDGDIDLYIAKCRLGVNDPNDGRRTNLLFQNDGAGNYTEVAQAAGLLPLAQSWAADFGDIDNDGDFDAVLLNHDMLSDLYRNDGPGGGGTDVFTDITTAAGLNTDFNALGLGIQVFFEDFDNDTYIDIMVTGRSGQHRLLMNNGDETFTAAANPFPTDGPGIQSASVGDLNNDGFPDLLAGFATGFNEPSNNPDRIFINPGNDNNWLNILLVGVESNRTAAGARIEITGAWGTQTREVRAGQGYGISLAHTRHFGLGTADSVDTVTIRWPSGAVDTFDDPPINTTLHVTEGCLDTFYADVDGDGFGDSGSTTLGCIAPKGFADNDTDCADDDANNFPGNPEVCDGADNNCDGRPDEGLDDCEPSGSSSGEPATDTGDGLDDSTGDDGTGAVTTIAATGADTAGDESTGGDAGQDDDGGGCGCRTQRPVSGTWLVLILFGLVARTRR